MDGWKAAKSALECVLEAKEGERLTIFCDDEKIRVGEAFVDGASKLGVQASLFELKTKPDLFRTKIPDQVVCIITENPPDIYVNLMRGNRQETVFRIALTKMETKDHKARLGHCPGVTMDMLTDGALALTTKEHRKMQNFAFSLIEKMRDTRKLEITNSAGTNLELSVEGRVFFTDTIIDWKTMNWMNLPTGEVMVAPVENSLEGTLVCDMAIGGIGPIKAPVKLIVEKGKAIASSSEDAEVLRQVNDSLNTDDHSSIVGEFAFGINPKARFVEEFLEAEKTLHTIHVAFGNNSEFPCGKNESKNHMDLLVSNPNVRAFYKDGSILSVLVNGLFQDL